MAEICIVVPVYKVEKYLRRCVDSILAQTFTDFSLILVDDGSPDNCGKICDEYAEKDKRITVIHQENGGLSAARNSGIDLFIAEKDRGNYITFIDSDDWVLPRYLEYMYRALKENGTGISTCTSIITKTEDFTVSEEYKVTLKAPEDYWVDGQGGLTVAWAKLYKRELFNFVRYPAGKIHEDDFTTYKLLFAVDKIALCETQLYAYFLSEQSITRTAWSEKTFDGQQAYQEQLLFFKQNKYKRALKTSKWLYALSVKHQIETFNSDKKAHLEHRKRLYRILRDFVKEYYRNPFAKLLLSGRCYAYHLINSLKMKWRVNSLLKKLKIKK